MIGAFTRNLYEIDTKNVQDVTKSIPNALQRLFFTLQKGQLGRTSSLMKTFGWGAEEMHQQNDVQEFNTVLMDALQSRAKKAKSKADFRKLFEGKYKTVIECTKVNYKSQNENVFTDLQLNVRGCKNIKQSLRKQVQEEMLEGDNQYQAQGFGKQDARKFNQFIQFPPVLKLQLMRFEFDPQTLRLRKVNDRFEFEEELDLSQFTRANYKKSSKKVSKGKGRKSSQTNQKSYKYHLHSILMHRGSIQAGHYFAYIRPQPASHTNEKNAWYKFNDQQVSYANQYEAFEQAYGGGRQVYEMNNGIYHAQVVQSERNNNVSAYMLVYLLEQQQQYLLDRPLLEEIPKHLCNQFNQQNRLGQIIEHRIKRNINRPPEVYVFSRETVLGWNYGGLCPTKNSQGQQAQQIDNPMRRAVLRYDDPSFYDQKMYRLMEVFGRIAFNAGVNPQMCRAWLIKSKRGEFILPSEQQLKNVIGVMRTNFMLYIQVFEPGVKILERTTRQDKIQQKKMNRQLREHYRKFYSKKKRNGAMNTRVRQELEEEKKQLDKNNQDNEFEDDDDDDDDDGFPNQQISEWKFIYQPNAQQVDKIEGGLYDEVLQLQQGEQIESYIDQQTGDKFYPRKIYKQYMPQGNKEILLVVIKEYDAFRNQPLRIVDIRSEFKNKKIGQLTQQLKDEGIFQQKDSNLYIFKQGAQSLAFNAPPSITALKSPQISLYDSITDDKPMNILIFAHYATSKSERKSSQANDDTGKSQESVRLQIKSQIEGIIKKSYSSIQVKVYNYPQNEYQMAIVFDKDDLCQYVIKQIAQKLNIEDLQKLAIYYKSQRKGSLKQTDNIRKNQTTLDKYYPSISNLQDDDNDNQMRPFFGDYSKHILNDILCPDNCIYIRLLDVSLEKLRDHYLLQYHHYNAYQAPLNNKQFKKKILVDQGLNVGQVQFLIKQQLQKVYGLKNQIILLLQNNQAKVIEQVLRGNQAFDIIYEKLEQSFSSKAEKGLVLRVQQVSKQLYEYKQDPEWQPVGVVWAIKSGNKIFGEPSFSFYRNNQLLEHTIERVEMHKKIKQVWPNGYQDERKKVNMGSSSSKKGAVEYQIKKIQFKDLNTYALKTRKYWSWKGINLTQFDRERTAEFLFKSNPKRLPYLGFVFNQKLKTKPAKSMKILNQSQ